MASERLEAKLEKVRQDSDKNATELLVLEVNQLFERDENSVNGTCFSLANQASEILFDDDMKTLFKSKIQWRNYMFRMAANGMLSINDVLYTIYTEPETTNLLKIPGSLIERLKEEFCLHWEFIKLSKSKLSPALVQFCLPMKNMEELRHTPWRVVSSRLQAAKSSSNDMWFVRKVWNQLSELRKALADFPGGMVDDVESIGIKHAYDISEDLIVKFIETYGLSTHQQELLNRMQRNKSSSIVEELTESIQGSASVLKRNLEEAMKLIKDIEQDKHGAEGKQKQLADCLDPLGINLAADFDFHQSLQLLKDNLRRGLETLDSFTTPYENDQDLIANINDRAAINGFHFGTTAEAVLSLADHQLFNQPNSSRLSKLTHCLYTKTIFFETSSQASEFQKFAMDIGIEAASLIREKLIKPNNEAKFQRTVLLCFHSYAVVSFRLEKHDLKLTSGAKDSLIDIANIASAKEFLKEYGTHFPIGTQRIGGVLSHIVEVVLPVADTKARLQDFANKRLQYGISQMKFTPTGNSEVIDYVTENGKVVSAQCTFSFLSRGPPVAHPSLFEKLNKVSWHNWQLIDRIDAARFSGSLLAVWKWLQSQEPGIAKQADFLRTAWVQMASKNVGYEAVIRQELHNVQENLSDRARVDIEKKIEDNVRKLTVSRDKEEEILKSLEEIFKNLHALKDMGIDHDPFLKYLGKNAEFRRLLVHLAESGRSKEDKIILFLRGVIDQSVIDLFQANACALEESVKQMLQDGGSALEAVKISGKLANVNLQNLVEYLSAEVASAKGGTNAHSIKWNIEAILGSALRREEPSNNVCSKITQVLVSKYAWSKNSFKYPMTLEAYRNMIDDVKTCFSDSAIEIVDNAQIKAEEGQTSSSAVPDEKPPPPPKAPKPPSSSFRVLSPRPYITAKSLAEKLQPALAATAKELVAPPQKLADCKEISKTKLKSPARETPLIFPLVPSTGALRRASLSSGSSLSTSITSRIERLNSFHKIGIQSGGKSSSQLMENFFQTYSEPAIETNQVQPCPVANKKTYFDLLIDKSPDVVKASPDVEMLHRLRHRMSLTLEESNGSLVSILLGAQPKNSTLPYSSYDTMLKMVGDYDASAASEIFQLLVESKFMVPLVNPMTSENYSKLLRHVKVVLPQSKVPISLGSDVALGRVIVISFRETTESQAPELIKSIFNLESFHRYDFARDSPTKYPFAVDLGLGCIARKSQSDIQPSVDFALVVHIIGKFEPFLNFMRDFADYLLIEDSPSEGFGTSFHRWIDANRATQPPNAMFSRKTQIMLWKPTSGKMQHTTPNENFENHGFHHTSVCGPLGDKLVELLASTVRYTIEPQALQMSSPWNERKSIRKLRILYAKNVEDLAPFDIDVLLEAEVKNLTETRQDFFLQHNFREQAAHEEAVREHRLDEGKRTEAEKKIEDCIEQRKTFAVNNKPSRLLKFFIEQLSLDSQCARVLTIRQLEKALGYRSDFELAEIQQRIDHYYALTINVKNANGDETVKNKESYVEAKREYRESMLHIEHLWREIGHFYVANPRKYYKFPKLAAQHLMDGFSIELLDGDANLINLEWMRAVLTELSSMPKKQKIFVLSVIGVQSSGKSTLLNTMFGIKMRTSVGQCTRGINMQLVPVEGRPEYDYILILDTEGTRSPDFYGTPLSEKRDNQMATLSILLADATVIVNPGENDAATKEILPVVLMAYQGSKLAEDNGGRLSSMMFFVYNRIDTTQKDKLTNVIQTLANSLVEAFDNVKKMGGFASPSIKAQTQDNCLFRNFKLDASNSNESDVRILGQNKLSFNPPNDIPDPAYGEALVEFREHIHRRVTNKEAHQWQSRSLGELSEYLDQIWQCICSTDFNLQFATVVERSNFDQLDAEYRKCETKFATACVVEYTKLREDMIKEMDSISDRGSIYEATYETLGDIYSPIYDQPNSFYLTMDEIKAETTNEKPIDVKSKQAKFNQAMQPIIKQQDEDVSAVLSRRGREKWRCNYEQIWELFKTKKMRHWRRQIKYSYDTIFKYDYLFEKFQKDMRKRIEMMFNEKAAPESEGELEELFEKLFEDNLARAKRDYPSIDVKARIYQCYSESPVIKQSTIDLSDNVIESQCVKLFSAHIGAKPSSRYEDVNSKAVQILNGLLKGRSVEVSHRLDECLYNIYEYMKNFKSQIECYDDSIVTDTIHQTDIFLKESDKPFEYTERKIAHFYARHALVFYMKVAQSQWEANNSVAAKLGQQANKEAMWQFFTMTARGEEKIKLFSLLVRNTFTSANLTEAFRERVAANVVELVKKQSWLYDFKWMQCYMDLYLVQLLDRNEVVKVLEFATNPLELYNEVLGKLLRAIAADLVRSGKEWEKFVLILKSSVVTAHEEAMSLPHDRARRYLERLRTGLASVLKSETLSQRLFICSGQEYAALDRDKPEDFQLYCKQEVLSGIGETQGPKSEEFVVSASQSALHNLRQENVSGVLWRCQACCPFCKSMCMKELGHDPMKVQHDTVHQPAGIAGIRAKDQQSLCAQSCSYQAKKSFLLPWRQDKNELNLKDWGKLFPMWAKPKQSEEWPLREYIFHTYNRELAELYGLKPTKKIPQRYKRDFAAIRKKLIPLYRGSLL